MNSLTLYSFSPAASQFWTNQAGSPITENYVVGSSSTGAYLLLGEVGQGGFGGNAFFLVDSRALYRANLEKQHPRSFLLGGRPLDVPADVSTTPAFSEDGKWYAFATSQPDKNTGLPHVEVWSANPTSKVARLDFRSREKELKPDCRIAGISFVGGRRSLLVGFEEKSFLLAFTLPERVPTGEPELLRPISINLSDGPPRGWAHRPDGKHIAIVSKTSIYFTDLTAPSHMLSTWYPAIYLRPAWPSVPGGSCWPQATRTG